MTDFLVGMLGASLLRSTAMLALAWLAARAVVGARVRHAIWTVAVIGALALPLGMLVLPRTTIPVPAAELYTWWQSKHKGVTQTPPAALPSEITSGSLPPASFPSNNAAAPKNEGWKAAVLLVWGAGVLILVLRLIVSVTTAARIVRRARRRVPSHVVALANEIVARNGWKIRVRLLASDEVSTPATVSWRRPAILLPPSAVSWEPARARAILTHELAHVARRDCLTQQLAQLACVFYWMNPLMWLAERRMEAERERVCDDVVLASGTPPHSYARLLVEMLRQSTNSRAASVLSMAHPSQIETRLGLILSPARMRGEVAPGRRLGIITAAAATVIVITVVNPAAANARVRPGTAPSSPAESFAALTPTLAPAGDAIPSLATSPEPDRLDDSVAPPRSERVPAVETVDPSLARAALAGPDSQLARVLVRKLDRAPTWEGDLVRARAAWAISRTRNGRLIEPLIEALDADDWRVRAYAAWALLPARDPRAVPGLIRALGHPVWRLRAMAAYSLRESRDPRARDAMVRALDDAAWQVRVSAVTHVGQTRGAHAERLLRPLLDDRHIMVRTAARSTLSVSSRYSD